MTPAKFTTHVRFMTRTTSVTFTDAQILALMEIRQDEIAKAILKTDEDILLIPQTDSLVADQREYPFPSDMLSRVKKVRAKFNGTDWIDLFEIDAAELPAGVESEASIVAYFNNLQADDTNPYGARYDIRRKAINIYSGTITSVSSGLKVYVNTYPAPITDLTSTTDMSIDPSTTTHGVPRELHEIWARGVIIDYKSSREKPIPLNERELSYKIDLQESIESLKSGNLDRETTGKLPPASSRGNNGFDY